MATLGQHPCLLGKIRFKMSRLMLWNLVLTILMSSNTMSLPIHDKETGPQLSGYMDDTFSHSGRSLKQANDFFDECEFGDTLQPYDETCANGATNLLPCNPGQLKVAACIGQGGDTSRICDPCPQKYYQSFLNKCTRCHQCSECGPNEEISEPCSDETDTVCRSIIPPEPVTATAPAPDTTPQSQAPARSTTTTTITNLPTTPQSSKSPLVPGVTYENVDQTTEIFSPETATAGNEVPVPIPAYKDNDGLIALAITASVLNPVLVLSVFILFYVCWKQRRKIKHLRDRLGKCTCTLSAESPLGPSVSPSSKPDGGLEPESSVGNRESSPTTQRTDPVVDSPDDEKTSEFIQFLSNLRDVVKDSITGKRKKKGKTPHVTCHRCRSGSGPSQSDNIEFKSLPSDHKTNLEKNNSSDNGESLGAHEPTPPVKRRADVESHPWNEKVPGSTITADVHHDTPHLPESLGEREPTGAVVEPHPWNEKVPGSPITADVHHNTQHIPGGRGCGDGESLVTGDVFHDSRPSHSRDNHHPDPEDPNDPAGRPGQEHNPVTLYAEKVPGRTALQKICTDGNESSTELPGLDSDDRWYMYAEKVPGSTALSQTSTDGNESSTEAPDLDSDVHLHAEKVPAGAVINKDRGTRNPDTVTDAPPDDPRTLRSSAGNRQAPISGEEEYEEAIRANNNATDTNAPTADTDEDVLQRLTEPEATAGNNNEDNTTAPTDTGTSEDEDGEGKPWNQRVLKLFTKRKRKNDKKRRNKPTQQTQQLITTMDIMVEESGLEYVADQLKLTKLDKLCRELGLKETEVENYKYELKLQQNTGAELAFKMLVKVRGSQGEKFTYRKLDRALRASNNVHVADGMVSMLRL